MRRLMMLPMALVALSACQQELPAAPETPTVDELTQVSDPPISPTLLGVGVPIDIKPEAVGNASIHVRHNNLLAVAILPNEVIDIEDVSLADESTDGVEPASVQFAAYYSEPPEVSLGGTVHDLTQAQAFKSHLKVMVDPGTGEIEVLYLVFHFDPGELRPGTINGCLTGTNQQGEAFWGCESVIVR